MENVKVGLIWLMVETISIALCTITKHRHAKRARVIFFVIGTFVELFTVMIWLSFFGCDVQQERHWEFMMYIRCYISHGKIAK